MVNSSLLPAATDWSCLMAAVGENVCVHNWSWQNKENLWGSWRPGRWCSPPWPRLQRAWTHPAPPLIVSLSSLTLTSHQLLLTVMKTDFSVCVEKETLSLSLTPLHTSGLLFPRLHGPLSRCWWPPRGPIVWQGVRRTTWLQAQVLMNVSDGGSQFIQTGNDLTASAAHWSVYVGFIFTNVDFLTLTCFSVCVFSKFNVK